MASWSRPVELRLSDEDVRRLAETVAAMMSARLTSSQPASTRWLDTRSAASYAGCSVSSLHKAMAARLVRFAQNGDGGKAWFRCEWIDAWREGRTP